MAARSRADSGGPTSLAGERRPATLVFSDLSGYTALNEALDPEEVVETMAEIHDLARRLAEEHGGVLNQVVGDEVVMLFGMSTSYGNDPVRAVEASIALNDAVAKLSRPLEAKLGHPLRMHTAVHTGLILFTEGDDRKGLYGMTGDAVNVGARIRSAAAAGEILLGPETQEIVAPFFETVASAPLLLKGKAEPVVVHRVIARGDYRSAFDVAQARGLFKHVGRDSESERLVQAFERGRAGEFQLAAVVGDAGVGKSRLLHALREHVEATDAVLLAGGCESYGSVPPYQPFLEVLKSLFELSLGESQAQSAERVSKFVTALDPDLESRVPFLLSLLSMSAADHPLPVGLVGPSLQETVLDALCALFRALSRHTPVAIVLEDWHWADAASDLALQRLVTALSGHAAFVVVSHRPTVLPSWHARVDALLDLRALGPAETEGLALQALQVRALSRGLSNFLFARTAGNPLFIEEFARALLEHDQIRIDDGTARLRASSSAETLPFSVEAVVRGRVDRLPQEEREVLSLAAVIGAQFAVSLLQPFVSDPDELPRILGHLEDARMIRRTGAAGSYAFSHIVVQEVVYESLLKRRRRELHAEVAQHIEASHEGDRLAEHFETLARHFGAGSMLDQASHYSEKAGDKAALAYSLEQASDQYRRAVEHLDAMPVSEEQQRRRVDMSLKWGRASIWRPSPQQLDVLRQSVDAARAIGHDRAVVRALYWMGWQQYTLGDQVSAIELLEQCVEDANAQADVRLESQAHANLGYCHAAGRDFEQALRRLERAGELQQQSSRRFWGDGYSLAYRGLIHGDLGDFEQAYECLGMAEADALEQNDLPLLGSILTQLGIVETWQGEWGKALATGRRLDALSQRVQGFYMMEMSKTLQGYAGAYLASELGEDAASMSLMETAMQRLEELSLRLSMSWNAACFAEVLAIRGHAERATRVARRSLERLVVGDRMGDAMAHRALAIASVRGPRPDRDAATEHLVRADQAANRAGLEREKAITSYWRASLWHELGDAAGARAACEPALPIFDRMQMAWYRDRAAVLLESL